jgi:hypothetical protein
MQADRVQKQKCEAFCAFHEGVIKFMDACSKTRCPRAGETRASREASREKIADHTAVDIGEAEVAARVTVRQLFMVKPERMKQRRVEIMHVHLVSDRVMPEYNRKEALDLPDINFLNFDNLSFLFRTIFSVPIPSICSF